MFKEKSPDTERRLYTRVRTGIPVKYRVWGIKEGKMQTHAQGSTTTYDVSQGGARLPLKISHKRLGTIELEFLTHTKIRASGRIRWFHQKDEKDQLDLGLEFTDIINEDRHRLLLYGFQQQQNLV
jgi:c-di-GMP-binding flagellar brake protein YcgR